MVGNPKYVTLLTLLGLGCCHNPAVPRRTADASAAPPSEAVAGSASTAAPALPSATVATVECPRTLGQKTDAQLEALVTAGDACAMNELGPRLFSTRDAAHYRRGAELLKRAFQAGVLVTDCNVFYEGVGMDPDFSLGVACLKRTEFPNELIVVLVQGDGERRYLDEAQAVVDKNASLGGMEDLAKVIERERTAPTKSTYRFCDGFASTTVELGFCGVYTDRLNRWHSIRRQGPAIDAMTQPQKALYNQLVVAFERYKADDVDQQWYAYANGSLRGVIAVTRRVAIGQEFDDLFDQVVTKRQLPVAIMSDLNQAKADLTTAEMARDDSVASGQVDRLYFPAEHRKRWEAAKGSWARYRDAWLRLGASLGGRKSAETRAQVELLVTKARIATMQTAEVN